jgi:hypothetical protein
MSYYTYNGLGQITQAAAGYGVIPGGVNRPGLGWVGSGGRNVPGIGLGDLFYEGGKAYWRVKDASETLSSIAVKVYGTVTAQKDIYNANPQGRWPTTAPACPDTKWHCWGWYKVGTLLELPKIAGLPDPMAAAPKSGMATAQKGETIVTPEGKVVTVGEGGKIGAFATLSTPMKIGLGVAAAAAVLGIAVLASKKKRTGAGGAQVIPITSARRAAANW